MKKFIAKFYRSTLFTTQVTHVLIGDFNQISKNDVSEIKKKVESLFLFAVIFLNCKKL